MISDAVRLAFGTARTGAPISAASVGGVVRSSAASLLGITIGTTLWAAVSRVKLASINGLPAIPTTIREIAGISQRRTAPIGRVFLAFIAKQWVDPPRAVVFSFEAAGWQIQLYGEAIPVERQRLAPLCR